MQGGAPRGDGKASPAGIVLSSQHMQKPDAAVFEEVASRCALLALLSARLFPRAALEGFIPRY